MVRSPRAPKAARARVPSFLERRERWLVAGLLAIHLGLALWGAARQSVTFDENFHVPDGVLIVARGDFGLTPVNPPLVKALFALPALAVGARLPDSAVAATHDKWMVGLSFMRRNADHYHRVFFAARFVVALLSCALGWVVWRFARRLYGPAGGLTALGFYAFSSEALAHAGVATLDVATGLAITAAMYAFWVFTRRGRWRAWVALAVVVGLAALTRFTTALVAPIFLLVAAAGTALGRFPRPGRVWVGLGLLILTTLAALQVGYLGRTSWAPIGSQTFYSVSFQNLQRRAPWLRLPLPTSFVEGLDIQSREGQGVTPTFLRGKILTGRVWSYFPIALLAKWPLGFLAALGARLALLVVRRRRRWHEAFVLVPAAVLLLSGMFVLQLNIGIRYLFPLVPLLCVWLGGFAAGAPAAGAALARGARRWAAAGAALALLQAAEVAAASPWYLAFYNRAFGGVGGGYRLVNDSNVDWGQGLIALREELDRRGIGKVHLAYHGTTDPAIYGIDYVPYLGGEPGPESDWLAVSSYYFVGLSQRMTTSRGRSEIGLVFDFGPLRDVRPAATPAGCMYLFRIRGGRAGM